MGSGRRWSIERAVDGRTLRIEPAPLWSVLLATTWPPVVLVTSALVVAWHTMSPAKHVVPLLVLGFAYRHTMRWPRRAEERATIGDDGGISCPAAGGDAPTESRIDVRADVTVRPVHAHTPFALSRLLPGADTPRVEIRSHGARLGLGLSLTDDEAQELVSALRAEGPLAMDRAPEEETTARVVDLGSRQLRLEMRRLERAPVKPRFRWWRMSEPRARTPSESRPADALRMRRLGPLRRSAAWREVASLVAAAYAVGYPAYNAVHGVASGIAIAATGALIVFPALVRLSQIAFAGTMEAQVVGAPAAPGAEVAIRVAQDRHGLIFDWLDLRLQCLHTVHEASSGFGSDGRSRVVTWEGLHRAPTDRLPLGPDDAMIVRFALPPDAPPTDEKADPPRSWVLEAEGMTRNGLYSESFEVVVLPAAGPGSESPEVAEAAASR